MMTEKPPEVREAERAAILPTICFGIGLLLMAMRNPFALLCFLAAVVYMIIYSCKHYQRA
jgi:4-hydroxybenzoate polyprenyltransferase